MYTKEQLTNAVFYAQQNPSDLANLIYDLNAFVRSDEKKFESFSLHVGEVDIAGAINQTNHTIAVTVPNGTTVTALIAKFTISDYASVKVSSTAQVSGTTTNDFTNPVTYTITAKDGSTQTYAVTVTVSA